MRGLIEKDLRLIFTRKETIMVFFVMALIMSASMNGTFIIAYLSMLTMIVAIGTISYDELDNGFSFLLTMPFSRKTYVIEKYLFSLIMTVAAWCIGVVLFCASAAIRHNGINLLNDLPMLIAVVPVMFLSADIMIPLQLKYGSEKSRIALFILFGLIAVLIFGAKSFVGGANNPFESLAIELENISPALVLLVIVAVCVVASFISYMCSVRIFEKKEF